MAAADLVFSLPPASGANLVFGDGEVVDVTIDAVLPPLSISVSLAKPNDATVAATLPDLALVAVFAKPNDATIAATLPGLTLDLSALALTGLVYEAEVNVTLPALSLVGQLAPAYTFEVDATLPALTLDCELEFSVNVSRPTVGHVATSHQVAAQLKQGVEDKAARSLRSFNGLVTMHSSAAPTPSATTDRIESLDRVRADTREHHTTTDKLRAQVGTSHQEMFRDRRSSVRTSSQDAIALRAAITTSSQDRYRDRRPSVRNAHQTAQTLRQIVGSKSGIAVHVRKAWGVRHQEAMRPPAGIESPVVPPLPEPCYTPSAHLLFADLPGNANLLFICENHITPPDKETVVVPIRSVYIVINDVTLRRVEGSVYLPTLSLSLSIDVDSWTWGFNATLPGQALDDVRSSDGTPVELEASINGNLYRLLAENVSRSRQFGNSTVSVSGRGKNAILDKPYSPILTFANSVERTAQQLMADVLTFNEIPLGWDIDWQLEDWLVPAGVFNVQGSYIDGLNTIVGAAGAYLQPHPTAQEFRALLRYPVAPWNWAAEVTPDFELPTAVTTQEGIEWIKKPDYNRVYVSGQQQGVNGRITRAGTAGDLEAPMVTHPLITGAIPARQRGLSILADTGRQALVSLRLPVLEETGVITPGAFVRYTDGGDIKLGIVRSTSVESSYPELWQQIQVESHE